MVITLRGCERIKSADDACTRCRVGCAHQAQAVVVGTAHPTILSQPLRVTSTMLATLTFPMSSGAAAPAPSCSADKCPRWGSRGKLFRLGTAGLGDSPCPPDKPLRGGSPFPRGTAGPTGSSCRPGTGPRRRGDTGRPPPVGSSCQPGIGRRRHGDTDRPQPVGNLRGDNRRRPPSGHLPPLRRP